MLKIFNPKTTAAPVGSYSHGVEVPPNARWLHIAGQVPVRPDGSVPATIEEQTEVVMQNIMQVLIAAGMGISDVVKVNSYLTKHENFARFAPVRAKYLGDHRPASTLAVISSLAKAEFLVEVEAIAAKAVGATKAVAGAAKKKAPAKKAKKRSR